MRFTVRHVKAARALLGWTQEDLAVAAGVGTSTVADFERLEREPIRATYNAIIGALTDAGITFREDGVLFDGLKDHD